MTRKIFSLLHQKIKKITAFSYYNRHFSTFYGVVERKHIFAFRNHTFQYSSPSRRHDVVTKWPVSAIFINEECLGTSCSLLKRVLDSFSVPLILSRVSDCSLLVI